MTPYHEKRGPLHQTDHQRRIPKLGDGAIQRDGEGVGRHEDQALSDDEHELREQAWRRRYGGAEPWPQVYGGDADGNGLHHGVEAPGRRGPPSEARAETGDRDAERDPWPRASGVDDESEPSALAGLAEVVEGPAVGAGPGAYELGQGQGKGDDAGGGAKGRGSAAGDVEGQRGEEVGDEDGGGHARPLCRGAALGCAGPALPTHEGSQESFPAACFDAERRVCSVSPRCAAVCPGATRPAASTKAQAERGEAGSVRFDRGSSDGSDHGDRFVWKARAEPRGEVGGVAGRSGLAEADAHRNLVEHRVDGVGDLDGGPGLGCGNEQNQVGRGLVAHGVCGIPRTEADMQDIEGSGRSGDRPSPWHVVGVVGAVFAVALLALQCGGCSSALADQCDALYAGADTPDKLAAAEAACGPDGGVR